MIQKDIRIVNRLGLHARAAAKLVHTAGSFRSEITVIKDGEEIDAKSILGLLQLGAAQGSNIAIRCQGEDEGEALDALESLIEHRFGEAT